MVIIELIKINIYNSKSIHIRKLSTNNSKTDDGNDKFTNNYKLSSFQKETLICLMLGEGYLEKTKSNHNTRSRL